MLLCLASVGARAQSSRTVSLSLSGAGSAMQNPTLEDYEAGYVTAATPLTWTVTVNAPRSNCVYSAEIAVRAASATIGNGKSVADVSWAAGGTFTALSTSYVTVATVPLATGTRSGTGAMTFRTILRWSETSGAFSGASLQFRVNVTTSGSGC